MDKNKYQLYQLTHAQKRIWYSEMLYPELRNELICSVVNFKKNLSSDLLEKAVIAFIKNEPDIRIRMHQENGECKQYYSEYQGQRADFVEFIGENAENETEQYFQEQYSIKFDLYHSNLFYFSVVKVNDTVKLFMKIHHIISDGWTVSVILDQVMNYYRAIDRNEDYLQNTDKTGKYLQYCQWEKEYLSSNNYKQNAEYWKEKFKTIPDDFSIEPYKKLKGDDYKSARVHYSMSAELVNDIRKFCKDYNVNIYHILLAALFTYIYRTTCREDIIISTFTHNRMKWSRNTVGMFVGTVPVRLLINNQIDFLTILNLIRNELWMCMKNQNYPYDQIINDIRNQLPKDQSSSLDDILVSYQNAEYPEEIEYPEWYFKGHINNIIAFHISDRGEKGILDYEIDYRTSLFNEEDIYRIFNCMCNLIQEGIRKPDIQLIQLDLLGKEQRDKLLLQFNNTKTKYNNQLLVHQKFEEQADRHPDHIAVAFKGNEITYSELNRKSNQLAWTLRNLGVKADHMIAILTDRTEEMLIGIFAILKAGGAYLPIDPNYPHDRINYMLEDCGSDIILTKKGLAEEICPNGKKIFLDNASFYNSRVDNLPIINNSNSLAYIIYTSGSTGKPKGVMIEHRAVVNFMKGMEQCIDFHEGKTILALTTVSFDIFILETLLPLGLGMKIVIADESEQIEPSKLNRLILEEKVDMVQMTPSRMQLLLSNEKNLTCLKELKDILLGGEAVTQDIIKCLKTKTCAKLYNMYGPTETTVWSSVKEIKSAENITIGKPIANTNIYIVNRNKELLPPGVIGEISIAGDGVARGYYKREELNSKKFVKIPKSFLKEEECYEIMYLTGDLGFWLPNGEIRFVGRIDTQVKLRGYRIELEEIERVVMEYGSIHKCAAIVKENENGYKYLVMYYSSEEAVLLKELECFLKERLPNYMIPSSFIWMKELPMTPNGKLDRKSLPEPAYCTVVQNSDFEAPVTEYERVIADIWKRILDKDSVDKNDNFFDIGGNSFFLVMMHSQLDRAYPGKVTIADIFSNPSVTKIAALIERSTEKKCASEKIPTLKLPEKYFAKTEQEPEIYSFHVKLNQQLQDAILYNCQKFEIKPYHFTLAMYLYFLAEVSENESISVQVCLENDKNVKQINLAFTDIESLEILFMKVKNLLRNSDNMCVYDMNNLKEQMVNKRPNRILPLFLYNTNNINIPQIYDFILKIECNNRGLEFFFEIKNNRIEHKAMKAFVQGYLEMLELAVKC